MATETQEVKESVELSSVSSRHDILDALRGFALFGICFANIPFFGGWLLVDGATKAAIDGAQFYDSFLLFAIDGRFYTIFSFLFGLGFSLQLSRLQQKDPINSNAIYLRRLVILLFIGLVHNFVIWLGDILLLYAVLGFVLFLLRRLSDKRILIIALIMLVLPIPGYLLMWYFNVDPDLGFYELSGVYFGLDADVSSFFRSYYESFNTPDLGHYFQLTPGLGIARVGYYFDTWRIPKVLGVMLLGMWAGRQLVSNKLLGNTQLFKRLIIIGMVVGIPASILYVNSGGLNTFQAHSMEGFWSVVAYELAVFPVAFAYASMFTLLWQKNTKFLSIFAAPGRMALTNYLAQTIISIGIFYGIGLQLGTTMAPLSFVVIAIVIFSSQVLLSNIWLRHYKYGPAEWLWRCLTYGQLLRIRR
jgi:uncharacterized protein